MKITAENYEQWALDYLEGNLSSEERIAFEAFLRHDTRAAEEIHRLQEFMPVAQAEPIVFPDSSRLRRRADVPPWRRFVSLVSGAAAAALIAGGFFWLDRSTGRPPQALGPGNTSSDSMSTAVWVAEAETPTPQKNIVSEREERSAGVSQARVSSVYASGSSRVSRWCRKTAEMLERMEAREERRQEISRVLAEETNRQTPQTTVVAEASRSRSSEFDEQAYQDLFTQNREEAERLWAEKPLPEHRVDPETISAASLSIAATEPESSYEPFSTEAPFETQSWAARREGGFLRALLEPLEKISPIKYYETEEGRGVEIASILRIGSRNRR